MLGRETHFYAQARGEYDAAAIFRTANAVSETNIFLAAKWVRVCASVPAVSA
jgi:hypothetical protein